MKERLSDILKQSVRSGLENVHTAIPGEVVEFDAAEAKARIRPLVRRKLANGDIQPLADVYEVPVLYPSSGDSVVSWPLLVGDSGILIFAERNIDAWLQRGGVQDPPSKRRFDLTDGMFVPGLWSFNEAPEVLPDAMLLQYKGSRIEMMDDKVVINGNLEVDS